MAFFLFGTPHKALRKILLLRALFFSAAQVIVLAACWLPTAGSATYAQEVSLQKRVGNWSVYCTKTTTNPRPQDCSVVTGVVADNDPTAWLKVGFSFSSTSATEPSIGLTLKTPRLDYFKNGISIGVDGHHVGQTFIDSCDKKSCETVVAVDPAMRQNLLAGKFATFEYQVNKTESISLAVNVEELPLALIELEKYVGLSVPIIAKNRSSKQTVMLYEVQLRSNPYLTADTVNESWGELSSCYGAPTSEQVKVSKDLKIQNDRQFSMWLDMVSHCSGTSVFWVTQSTNPLPENTISTEAGMYVVYDALRDKVPHVVVSGIGGVPLGFVK